MASSLVSPNISVSSTKNVEKNRDTLLYALTKKFGFAFFSSDPGAYNVKLSSCKGISEIDVIQVPKEEILFANVPSSLMTVSGLAAIPAACRSEEHTS